jgi:hypothetical protein
MNKDCLLSENFINLYDCTNSVLNNEDLLLIKEEDMSFWKSKFTIGTKEALIIQRFQEILRDNREKNFKKDIEQKAQSRSNLLNRKLERPFLDLLRCILEEELKDKVFDNKEERKEFICKSYNKSMADGGDEIINMYKKQYKDKRMLPPKTLLNNSKLADNIAQFLTPLKDRDNLIYPF